MKTKGHNNSLYFKILFVISLGILLFISAITFKHISTISKSTDLVVRTHIVNLKLEQLLSTMKDAETGVRGYLLTNDKLFLEPYIGSRPKVMKLYIELKKLTSDNSNQQGNLDRLLILINKRYVIFNYNINNTLDKKFIVPEKVTDNFAVF